MADIALSESQQNPPPIIVDLAGPGDVRAAIFLFEEMLRFHKEEPPLATDDYADQLEADGPSGASLYECLLARDSGKPVGFLMYSKTYDPLYRRCVHMQDLFVTEDCRARGVGKALMVSLAQRCLTQGWARVDWRTDRLALDTRAFYDLLCPDSFKLHKLTYRLYQKDIEALAKKPV